MMPLLSLGACELLAALPAIRRARGFRLYAENGRRYLDLYADGGRCAMGRKTGSSALAAKQAIDRGLVSAFPSFWEKRLEKQILSWLPGYAGLRFFAAEEGALWALADTLGAGARPAGAASEFVSAALADFASTVALELPFGEYRKDRGGARRGAKLGTGPGTESVGFALALLPLAPAWSFGVLLAMRSEDLEALDTAARASGSGSLPRPIPAVKLAVASRALSDFLAFTASPACGEKSWSAIDPLIAGLFTRSGPWLYPAYPQEEHREVFSACLKNGLLISPEYSWPSLVPGEFDKGEVAPLKAIARGKV